ncbi:MAG: PorP/SprF family type IX secretion system membrane protein [Chitinophagales bacterium]|nr:PorP/SprF family type IX secretion system membrane protein [Chitinophagales bacterium]
MKIKLLSIVVVLFLSQSLLAQDYKFSQFYNSPQNLNPALTGKLKSLYRVVANYRTQYFTVQSPAPYSTLSASADFGLLRDQLNDDILGVGIVFSHDRQSVIKTNTMAISAAYHKGIGYKKNHYISAGFQVGFTQRSVDQNNLYFEDQFNATDFAFNNPTAEVFDQYKFIKPNINLGLFWSSNFTKTVSGYIGMSMFNILSPRETFLASNNERKFRYNVHLGSIIQVKKLMIISPNAMFMQQGKNMQWIAGSQFGFNLSGKGQDAFKNTIFTGIWYDGNGAIIASVGMQASGFQVGVSYDATIDKDLNQAVNSVGALELSLIYTGKQLQQKKVYQPLFCPKF